MKRREPCTLWHIKKGVPQCENWVQVIIFSRISNTFKYIEALSNFLYTDK